MTLIWNWKAVLKRAWSVRLNLTLALASAADAAIGYAVDGRWLASAAVAVCSLAATGSRVVMQRDVHELE